jgi:hypothetical protein
MFIHGIYCLHCIANSPSRPRLISSLAHNYRLPSLVSYIQWCHASLVALGVLCRWSWCLPACSPVLLPWISSRYMPLYLFPLDLHVLRFIEKKFRLQNDDWLVCQQVCIVIQSFVPMVALNVCYLFAWTWNKYKITSLRVRKQKRLKPHDLIF